MKLPRLASREWLVELAVGAGLLSVCQRCGDHEQGHAQGKEGSRYCTDGSSFQACTMTYMGEVADLIVDDLVTERVLNVMQRALEADPAAVSDLVGYRVACNEVLADDPTIQVQSDKDRTRTEVGLLGILNGITGSIRPAGPGRLAVLVEHDGMVSKIGRYEELTSNAELKPPA